MDLKELYSRYGEMMVQLEILNQNIQNVKMEIARGLEHQNQKGKVEIKEEKAKEKEK